MVLRSHTEEGEERFWFDILSAIVLFMTAIGGAWLPRYLCSPGSHISSSKSLAFHLGNMLSAGVMLSAGFCHLLADAHRTLLFVGRFPISNFLAAIGYIVTLLADQVVQAVSEQSQDAAAGSAKDNSNAGALRHNYHAAAATAGNGTAPAGGGVRNGGYHKVSSGATELTSMACCGGGVAEVGGGGGAKVVSAQEGLLTTAVHRGDGAGHGHSHAKGHDLEQVCCGGGGVGDDGSKQPLLATSGSTGRSQGGAAGAGAGASGDCHSSGVVVLLGAGKRLSFATAVLLASALCIHSILEGMALGAQTSMRSTEDIMVAIAAHKGLAAYALGASIMESGASSNRFWTVIGCFSLATPIGIFAGYGMSSAANSQSGAALSALASGTFLYVAFMEVIPKELADGKHRAAKMAAFLLGYSLMSLLAVWA